MGKEQNPRRMAENEAMAKTKTTDKYILRSRHAKKKGR